MSTNDSNMKELRIFDFAIQGVGRNGHGRPEMRWASRLTEEAGYKTHLLDVGDTFWDFLDRLDTQEVIELARDFRSAGFMPKEGPPEELTDEEYEQAAAVQPDLIAMMLLTVYLETGESPTQRTPKALANECTSLCAVTTINLATRLGWITVNGPKPVIGSGAKAPFSSIEPTTGVFMSEIEMKRRLIEIIESENRN